MKLKKQSGIILALDVESKEKALRVCEEVRDHVDAIKVGYPLILSAGLSFISELKRFRKPIIADFKVADIPEISSRICRLASENGAGCVIVQGFVGEDVIRACSKAAKIFVVAEMSHEGAKSFMARHAEKIAGIAKKYAYGIVAPATRPERIKLLRKIVGDDILIISPGVKAQGAKVGDAVKAGADFEIIGRGIYNAENPKQAAREAAEIIRRI